MPFDANQIRLGAARVLLDGLDLGFTYDGVTIDVRTTSKRVEIDHFGPIEVRDVVSRRETSIKFNVAETALYNLALSLWGAATVDFTATPNNLQLPFGVGTLLNTSAPRLLELHPIDRDYTDCTENFRFLNAAWSGNVGFAFKVDQQRVFAVEFFAYPDQFGNLFMFGAPIAYPATGANFGVTPGTLLGR